MSNPLTGSPGPIWVRQLSGGFGQNIRGQLCFGASVNVADPAALADNEVSLLSLTATGDLRVRLPAGGTPIFPVVVGESVGAAGRATAPGAGAVIATIAAGSLPAGTYDFQVMAQFDLGAPVAATETNNMEFREGATVVSVLSVLPVINIYSPVRTFRRTMDGATAVSVNATAAGTAGVGYNAQIIALRLV